MALLVMMAGLAAGSYLLFLQHNALLEISDDARLLTLRTERLENLIQSQENREVITEQEIEQRAQSLAEAKVQQFKKKQPAAQVAKAQTPAKPEPVPAAGAAKQTEKPATEKTEPEATQDKAPPADEVSAGPAESDLVEVRDVSIKSDRTYLRVTFKVAKKDEKAKAVAGYVTLVARGERAGRPWVEAWPPMRLTPLGRPANFRRGTPFSVAHFRRIKARLAKADKKFKRLEFLVYDREGKVILVVTRDLNKKPQASRGMDWSQG